MRRFWLVPVTVLALSAPAPADVYTIDPASPPPPVLSPAEVAKLATLQNVTFPLPWSDISPDDRVVATFGLDPTGLMTFLDIRTGENQPIAPDIYPPAWLTEFRWRDPRTMAFVGAAPDGSAFWWVTADRATGTVTHQEIALPGYPVSLSLTGRRVLLARQAPPTAPDRRGRDAIEAWPPVRNVPLVPRYLKRRGPAVFEAEERMRATVSLVEVEYVVYDLETGRERVLLRVPEDTAITGIGWAPNDRRLSLVRWKFASFAREDNVPPDDDPGVLDSLGRLEPRKNPFFTTNALDIFHLAGKKVHHVELRPCAETGEVAVSTTWGPDSFTVMVQTQEASRLEGRDHPTFGNPDRSRLRFVTAYGTYFDRLARMEISSTSLAPFFVSEHEVVVAAPWQMSWGLYYYNLRTHQFRRLPTGEGALYYIRATRHSRELVFNYSSFQEPYEIHRIGLGEIRPTPLSNVNAAARAANRIRVDKVAFALKSGAVREGRLIQAREAVFPPRRAPILLWQQGGPTRPMLNEWGSSVESPFALLPNFGFPVLVVPLQGRINFGPRLLDDLANGTNFGQFDIDEGAEIARQIVHRGWTKRDRLGITGCSYGGYFTSQSITRHPDLYAAANSQCSLLDLVYEWDRGYKAYIGYLEGRTPAEDLGEWQRDSPFYWGARVKTPTLLFAGKNDFLPFEFSQKFHDDINAAGTKADFYVFEQEGHGLGIPANQLVAGQAQVQWFRKYLRRD